MESSDKSIPFYKVGRILEIQFSLFFSTITGAAAHSRVELARGKCRQFLSVERSGS